MSTPEPVDHWTRLRRKNPDAFAALKGYEVATKEILALAVRASLGEKGPRVTESCRALELAGRAWAFQVLRVGRDRE